LLILTGVFGAGLWWAALIALLPIVLAAAYMLRLFQTMMNGPTIADLPERRDLSWIEGVALAPLIAGFVFVGIDPHPLVGLLANGANVVAHLR
jgi:NADH-quinone oxidoreductase subunit M